MTSSSPDIRESLFSPRLLLGMGVALFGGILMLDRLGLLDAGSDALNLRVEADFPG